MSKVDGAEFKLYYSTTPLATADDATIAGLPLTEATEVASVTRGNERSSSEFRARSGVIRTTGAQELSLDITLAYDTTDAFYTALVAAMKNNTEIAIADVDGSYATNGTKGITGNFKVESMPLEEPDEGPATMDITLVNTSFPNPDYTAP